MSSRCRGPPCFDGSLDRRGVFTSFPCLVQLRLNHLIKILYKLISIHVYRWKYYQFLFRKH
ncbi:hypothetical protein RchiOBHm_Chr5g0040151 [Rosa chinensis]|uniref:Uncharacterized protein n=1 Tax=Rosa chinensis TaxID=74649 RepID=A0A2P6QCF8_ROSCH|nr:hypothetical protein RchiOBHm_Chr5g0040151 [Rosa chinensis]